MTLNRQDVAETGVGELAASPATDLPTISIVVPNYNGGATIGKTLQSLVDQNYPNLEIIVTDGASSDNSVEVIKQYEAHIAWWVSEKDNGQSDAINKGFAHCTGDIVNWLCSDDLLPPGALHTVGQYFAESSDLDVLVGQGRIEFTDENIGQPRQEVGFWLNTLGKVFGVGPRSVIQDQQNSLAYTKAPTQKQIGLLDVTNPIAQPSCFYRRSLLKRPQPVDESYHYAMDTELWNYFQSQGATWKCVDDVLSISIQDGENKTSTGGYKVTLELERLYNTYVNEPISLMFWHRRLRYPLERFMALHPGKLWLYTLGPTWVLITLGLAPFYGLNRVWTLRWKRWV